MIAHISGKLIYKSLDYAIIDVNGVGYQVYIPLSTFYKLPDLYQQASLNAYTHVSENALSLYGFYTTKEKELFELLIGISGVGPRLARNILSGISADELTDALIQSNTARLNSIPGIGAKTAQRLVVELKDKVMKLSGDSHAVKPGEGRGDLMNDVTSALRNLGYKASEADRAVREIKGDLKSDIDFETAFREALKVLTK